jgi:hypothetical protein
MQLAILWSIGRVAFGIKPARPLRILIVQSEDDDAESKKFVQMIRELDLSQDELNLMRENTRFEFQRALTGEKFIEALDCWLTEFPAEVVIINPLSGFLLCDLKEDEKVGTFLRKKLSGVMEKHKCGTNCLSPHTKDKLYQAGQHAVVRLDVCHVRVCRAHQLGPSCLSHRSVQSSGDLSVYCR